MADSPGSEIERRAMVDGSANDRQAKGDVDAASHLRLFFGRMRDLDGSYHLVNEV